MVTASGGDEQDQRPSRFLAELAGDDIEIERAGAATRWLSLPALVADLRRTAADPATAGGRCGRRRPASSPGSRTPGCAAPTRATGTR